MLILMTQEQLFCFVLFTSMLGATVLCELLYNSYVWLYLVMYEHKPMQQAVQIKI